MKKNLLAYLFSLMACVCMLLASCDKPEPIVPGPGDEEGQDTTVVTYSILGHWALDSAMQNVGGNNIDVTAFYGTNFQLTFEEDGTLITSDGINEVPMQWNKEGDQVGFIQAPGMDPVMYTVKELSAEKLIMENGAGTDYVTTLYMHRD